MKRIFGLLLLFVVLFSCTVEKEEVVEPSRIPPPVRHGKLAFNEITSTSVKVTIIPTDCLFSEMDATLNYFDITAADTVAHIKTIYEVPDSISVISNLKPSTTYVFKLSTLSDDISYHMDRLTFTTAPEL